MMRPGWARRRIFEKGAASGSGASERVELGWVWRAFIPKGMSSVSIQRGSCGESAISNAGVEHESRSGRSQAASINEAPSLA